jgi:hypothetical protein
MWTETAGWIYYAGTDDQGNRAYYAYAPGDWFTTTRSYY